MIVLAIDPGTTHSAFVVYDGRRPTDYGKLENEFLRADITHSGTTGARFYNVDSIAVEMIASYGMPVGYEVFDTCVEIGRILEAWTHAWRYPKPATLIYRKDVKLHLCNSPRANDASIRQALIDRYGGKERAIGRKASQGPLYGISADVWSALAIAVTVTEQTKEAA